MKIAISTFCMLLLSMSVFAAQVKTVTLVSMNIPPFMSPDIPENGAAIVGLREIFAKMGYELKVKFVPIQRTRNVGLEDKSIAGFFPSFVDDDFVQGMKLSKTVYKTPWVIIERKDNPIKWKTASDLLKYKGGNVGGYTLRSQVAPVFKAHPEALEDAPADAQNLMKLALKRIDYVFIDRNVFGFLVANDPNLRAHAQQLQINPKIVALNEYGVAFKTDKENAKIMEQFNKTATEEGFTQSVEAYIKRVQH
ncbi:ABC transporter substrate-binding protein [Bdellovibrio sp. NC01]|uniref:substrate-binding periplasmic protein n=1 Tax=Bdellovibrio sp. NC01 TaxID=2220073 RepID=UPI001159C871|nr:ABC transporter substrate-binding protein [Bdellovibrio sp. NC01]QDK37583.1 hypothetical protein DOE51_08285 [Bdellovibrio sp. NC01]